MESLHRKCCKLSLVSLAAVIALSACGSKPENAAGGPAGTAPASTPAATPAATPTTTPTAPAAAPEPVAAAPAPVKPPPPKKYVVAAGTAVSVRTLSEVSTKSAQSGSEFEATLESPLVVNGHTVAKKGASVVGRVVNADQGGRAKGKASLTLALARLSLANGDTAPIQTNSVTVGAESGTKKNVKRTAIASGAGAAIGAIAGGGKGAAIGAGVGAGAGLATNLATKGPAADIPAETVLKFSLAKTLVVTEQP